MKRSRLRRSVIRSLRPGEPIPEGEPRRYKSSHGYVRLRWRVGPQQYVEVYEHRLIAGMPAAEVHHRDHSKDNNDPSNLTVLSKVDHAREHGQESAARSRRVTEWGGHRSQNAYDKAQRRKSRVAERKVFLARLAELHDAGHTTVEIGAMVGRDPSNISRALRQAGRAPMAGIIGANVGSAVRSVVHARAGMCCERCGDNLIWKSGHIHHRIPRGMGGSDDAQLGQPGNLLYLCSPCHGHVESQRAEAYDNGWLVRRGFDPATVPVLVDHGSRWVYLDHVGGMSDNPPEAVGS